MCTVNLIKTQILLCNKKKTNLTNLLKWFYIQLNLFLMRGQQIHAYILYKKLFL